MEVAEVLIEHWPRLQSVNIFIQFSQPFIDSGSVHIKLTKTEIRVDGDANVTINVRDHFTLNTHSLSLLIIKSNYISFRLNTNNNDGFYEEFLQNDLVRPGSTADSRLQLEPSICAKNEVTMMCSTCMAPLLQKIRFQRILELPSDNLDSSEWFCHKHAHNASDHELPSVEPEKFNSAKVTARPLDLLYGDFFFLLNSEELINTISHNDRIHCKRCLSHLGELQVRTESIKFWNENILFKKSPDKAVACHLFEESIFDNFLFIVHRIIRDFDFILSATAGVVPTIKMLFESRTASSVDDNVRYLLLQVMNKNVEMYRQNMRETADDITLRKISSMKILYRHENAVVTASLPQSPLISFWLADATVTHTQISCRMMEATIERLRLHSLLVPECYRSNCGFTLSYLFK